jgi:hypothetical protein
MNKKIAKKWVEALRSGEYRQGREALCRIDPLDGTESYCCLGVLTDLYQKDRKKKKKKLKTRESSPFMDTVVVEYFSLDSDDSGASGVLPDEVRKWAGMFSNDGIIHKPESDYEERLTEFNDGGKSFKQIANIIEKNVENL